MDNHVPRPSDRQISKKLGQRPLTPRQKEVLEAMEAGGTEWKNYLHLVDSGRWRVLYGLKTIKHIPSLRGKDYALTFLNFRQHLINAYGRLGAHNLREALRIYRSIYHK